MGISAVGPQSIFRVSALGGQVQMLNPIDATTVLVVDTSGGGFSASLDDGSSLPTLLSPSGIQHNRDLEVSGLTQAGVGGAGPSADLRGGSGAAGDGGTAGGAGATQTVTAGRGGADGGAGAGAHGGVQLRTNATAIVTTLDVRPDSDISAGETGLIIRVDPSGGIVGSRVTVGAVDSGGVGFRLLRVPN